MGQVESWGRLLRILQKGKETKSSFDQVPPSNAPPESCSATLVLVVCKAQLGGCAHNLPTRCAMEKTLFSLWPFYYQPWGMPPAPRTSAQPEFWHWA